MSEGKSVTPSFGSRLFQLMEEMAVTQRQVAEFAEVNEASVSRWISGSIPSIETVELLAKKTGVSFNWLAFGEGTLEPKIEGVNAFVNRARKTILPRLDSIITRLNSVQDEPWLARSDWEAVDGLIGQFTERRGRLVELVRTMEQIPQDDVPGIEQKLFGTELSSKDKVPLLDLRFRLCRMLGLDRRATNAELIDAFGGVLRKSERTQRVFVAREKLIKLSSKRKASKSTDRDATAA